MKQQLAILIIVLASVLYADGKFYRQYWAEYDKAVSNRNEQRWRVNDPDLSLHENFGKRDESRANGLVLLKNPEDLFALDHAELYLELWGGHPHTTNKRFTVNGKGDYIIPEYGTADNHCVYAYPTIPIQVSHLVTGTNAFQFSCDRGRSFWGHFIMDNVGLTCFYKTDSLIAYHPELAEFAATVKAPAQINKDNARLAVDVTAEFSNKIASVEYFAAYTGFDDNGNNDDADWHGYTFKKEWTHHVGRVTSSPWQIDWNTAMIPDQARPIQFKAIIQFKDGLFYETEPTAGTLLLRQKESVQMFYCYDAPIPFWSRANNLNTAKMFIPVDPAKIISAQLHIKIWDGGEGSVTEPFKINGHAYPITSTKSIHDVVHTVLDVDPDHLQNGDNVFELLSDTHHHGIEILRPGPCLIIRIKN
jgi:hypothetical protein